MPGQVNFAPIRKNAGFFGAFLCVSGVSVAAIR
jgi:hypothetical protein